MNRFDYSESKPMPKKSFPEIYIGSRVKLTEKYLDVFDARERLIYKNIVGIVVSEKIGQYKIQWSGEDLSLLHPQNMTWEDKDRVVLYE